MSDQDGRTNQEILTDAQSQGGDDGGLTTRAEELAGPPGGGGFVPPTGGGGAGIGLASVFGNLLPPELGGVEMEGLGAGPGDDEAVTVAEVLQQAATLDEAALSFLQRRLFRAGFYAGDAYLNVNQIRWGELDAATQDALQLAMDGAVRARAEDFDHFLQIRAGDFTRTGITAAGENVGAIVETLDSPSVTLTDPASIQIMAESAAQELLGRNPTERELAAITAKIHDSQRSVARQRADLEVQAQYGGTDLEATATLLQGEPNIPTDYDPAASDVDDLDGEQLNVVRTIVNVGTQMGLSEEYMIGAISAGIVESGLRNVNFGDRDSLGVFQQRAHYGDASQRTDVEWSARAFFQEMLRYQGDTLGEWVANTQRPAKQFRGRYADVMNDAARIYEMVLRPSTSQGTMDEVRSQFGATTTEREGRAPRSSVDSVRDALGFGRTTGPRPSGADAISDIIGRQLSAVGRAGRAAGKFARPETSDIESPTEPIAKDPPGAHWIQNMLDGAVGTGGLNEIFQVDPQATAEMELRQLAPVDYESKQLANRGYEWMTMLGAGGGLV